MVPGAALLIAASCDPGSDNPDTNDTESTTGMGTTSGSTPDTGTPTTSSQTGDPNTSVGPSDDSEGNDGGDPSTATTADEGGEDTGDTDTGGTNSSSDGSDGPAGDSCDNDMLDGDETDIDCGGSCPSCAIGSVCMNDSDCTDDMCDSGSCLGPAPGCDIDDVEKNPGNNWFDSYSVDGKCYCDTTFDHNIGDIEVSTPYGTKTVKEICDEIGPGPGGGGHPKYNDIQCGNGPANDAGDEDWCPGRVDQGKSGCCTIGPKWDLSVFE